MAKMGFVSTRFAGTDGVSLESTKWAYVLRKLDHECFWFAGELDRNPENIFLVPEAHFKYHDNKEINYEILGKKTRSRETTDKIHDLKEIIKNKLYEFVDKFNIDVLIAENVLSIPMHIPFGIALTEYIGETGIKTIDHGHDFHWERKRFSVNSISEYLDMAFPPKKDNIEHVVLNTDAQDKLALYKSISSIIIPNVLDFKNPPAIDEKRCEKLRKELRLEPDDKILLQPTRVIKRKGIETAIELAGELKNENIKLVISHEAGDEGSEYLDNIKNFAHRRDVNLHFLEIKLNDPYNGINNEEYSLWDVYPLADFITFPSRYEGFGNAFIEAVYFKKPLLINRYPIFITDIEPRGFDLVVMDDILSNRNIDNVRMILGSPEERNKIVEHNYETASVHYSYGILQKTLKQIINNFGF